jgi:hypothetical protein
LLVGVVGVLAAAEPVVLEQEQVFLLLLETLTQSQ